MANASREIIDRIVKDSDLYFEFQSILCNHFEELFDRYNSLTPFKKIMLAFSRKIKLNPSWKFVTLDGLYLFYRRFDDSAFYDYKVGVEFAGRIVDASEII